MIKCFPCAVLMGLIVGVVAIIPALRSFVRVQTAHGACLLLRAVKKLAYSSKQYRIELVVIAVGFGVMNAIFLADAFRGNTVSQTSAGQLGDFVGGYVGTLFALVSVLLLYRTLRNQRDLSERTGFETKFYELLKLHRENVTEMRVQDVVGRRIFVLMIAELRRASATVSACAAGGNLSTEELWHIAYYFFFFGVGQTSTPMVEHALSGYSNDLIHSIRDRLLEERREQAEERMRAIKEGVPPKQPYVHFDGHQSRLGHYYRHLYQAIAFIDGEKTLSQHQKYSYAKMLRAQLSTHEQALLLINSLTPFGTKWWDEDLINRYHLVKNLPPEFFDANTEIDTALYFERGYFEVDELQKRPKSRTLK